MGRFTSTRWRLFLVCQIVFSLHFSTNVVREHYPAFALIDHGDFKLDEYLGFHADIFRHSDGHAYIGNQIAGSLPAVPALWLFDPLLDHLEARSKAKLTATTSTTSHYDTEYPNRGAFLRLVRERGLDLRFGAATVVTSVFCMAPLSALLVVLLFGHLLRRGVAERRAAGLALLFAFATPVLYRASHLNHNVFLTLVVFASFLMLVGARGTIGARRAVAAGFFAGLALALDYAGAIAVLALFFFLVIPALRRDGLGRAFAAGTAFVAGTLPPTAFLLWSQWRMFGDPFKPGQFHMPDQNVFVGRGMRGMDWPDADIFIENLFSPDFGLLPFAPLLALSIVPALYGRGPRILNRREGVFVAGFSLAFLAFCAANSYSLLQFNTGFRYLMPLVPFLFLAAADHLVRCPRALLLLIAVPALAHSWVLAMVRFTRPSLEDSVAAVPESWRRVVQDGLQLPWLNVLKQTTADGSHFVHWRVWPAAAFIAATLLCVFVWRRGAALQVQPVATNDAGSLREAVNAE